MQIVDSLGANGHNVTVACRRGSALHERLLASQVDFVPVRFGGDVDPVAIVGLARLIAGRKIDVVCAHTEKELRIGGIASVIAGVPVIVSREVDLPIRNSFVNRLFFGKIASAVIANSYATKNTLLISAPWLPPEMIHVVWKGVDPLRFRLPASPALRDEFCVRKEDCLIGFVGRLDEQKGLMTLLESMAILDGKRARAKLVVAGEGNLHAIAQAFVENRGLSGTVCLAGFREDIPEFLRGIDFLVMPSNWEGFGYSAVEAMAAGKAVIATHVSSLPEIIEDGKTGILVPPRAPDLLAAAMITLVDDPRLRIAMGKAGARKAENAFSLSSMISGFESVLLDVARIPRDGARDENAPHAAPAGWRLLYHWLL